MGQMKRSVINGIKAVKIPNSEWRCPSCGRGPQGPGHGGLVHDCEEDLIDGWLALDDPVYCDRVIPKSGGAVCNWSGTVNQVYLAALRRLNEVECPCCKGRGIATKKNAAKWNRSK